MLPAYTELLKSDIAGLLKRYGGSPAPLSVVGMFLNAAGNTLLKYIDDVYKQKVLLARHEVVSIKV